ncbi:hypothetical protein CR162_16150 [Pseudoroseomonas rhizosphaerae]|uniref:DUF533 domain-containing protein n=1 Tax=Teichococcus rhizosphaerae TaxID=1335062 RepID=A0A2C6XZK6_9PROT|nr:hypothetical protein [Pseudoroseomonas rhizosphaerae]PHK93952.1 hypothetical protein CR162_16150 [Pseudoroseomonas rhizosphaerae]
MTTKTWRLLRWLGLNADGRSELLERQALALPATPPPAPPPPPGAAPPRPPPPTPQRLLQEQVATKLLHGWLQNRHQTLFPLALNLGNLPPPHRLLLARCMQATAAMTGAPPPAEALAAIGGGAAERAALAEAPPPLPELLSALQREGLGAHAYSAALLSAAEARVGQAWLDYLAAAFALPPSVTADLRRRGGRRLRPRSR